MSTASTRARGKACALASAIAPEPVPDVQDPAHARALDPGRETALR